MKSRLIVIRGNSGSGKTTLAKALRSVLPNSILLSQDVIRREILNVKDGPGIPAILLEGILAQDRYGEMIDRLERRFTSRYTAYYFDVSFEETVRRHAMRQPTEFSETDMKRWWIDQDHRSTDRLIAENRSIASVIQMIEQEQMGEIE